MVDRRYGKVVEGEGRRGCVWTCVVGGVGVGGGFEEDGGSKAGGMEIKGKSCPKEKPHRPRALRVRLPVCVCCSACGTWDRPCGGGLVCGPDAAVKS